MANLYTNSVLQCIGDQRTVTELGLALVAEEARSAFCGNATNGHQIGFRLGGSHVVGEDAPELSKSALTRRISSLFRIAQADQVYIADAYGFKRSTQCGLGIAGSSGYGHCADVNDGADFAFS